MTDPTQLTNIESLINSYQARLNTISYEIREQKEMLQSLLDNNEEYQQSAKEADKLAKLKSLARQKALKVPEAIKLVDKIKDQQSQLREIKTALSDYLTQYLAISGSTQFELADGQVLEILYTAKLVKKKS